MGRYAKLVDTPEAKAVLKAQYRIPNGVEIHCEYGEWLVLNRPFESVVIPMIVLLKAGWIPHRLDQW